MSRRVFVSGIGIVSALGIGKDATLKALKEAKPEMSFPKILNTNKKLPVAEVPYTNDELASQLCIENAEKYSRTSLLGLLASQEALLEAKLSDHEKLNTGFISGTSVGGMSRTEDLFKQENSSALDFLKEVASTHDCGESTETMASFLGLNGETMTLSTACSSAANAVMMGARLIKSGKLDRVIVGGSDSLSRFTLNGFDSLMILDSEHCKPFDRNRKGLNLGEGAGYLVLEAEDCNPKNKFAEVRAYANTNDAYHQTASSPEGEGAYLSIKNALKLANLSPDDIDYINAHGTGTKNNDQSETIAINRIFKAPFPKISSTKAYTGHTLGAAGGIEAVFSVFAIQEQVAFPNLNFNQAIEESNWPVNTSLTTYPIRNVLSNSFGFGGNCTSLIFSKISSDPCI